MKYYYPAVFEPKKNGAGFVVSVPDIQGCFTQGDNIAECMYMAQEAIGCMLEDIDAKNYPVPSSINEINLSDYSAGSFATLVTFDKTKYDFDTKKILLKNFISTRRVKKRL